MNKKILVGVLIAGVCFFCGAWSANIYKPSVKNFSIYSQAMSDLENKDYSNAYYLFSKISFTSDLKPYAIYHQAQCANLLEDKKSELKQYKFLFEHYGKNVLSLRAKYMAAQASIDVNPLLAENYFSQIIKTFPETDYAIASEYYLGLLALNKYKNNSQLMMSDAEKSAIEMKFRNYLTKASNGKHALNVANAWLSLDKPISSADYLLLANVFYNFDNNEKAKEMLYNVPISDGWVLDVKNSYALNDFSKVKSLTLEGLHNYVNKFDEKDLHDIADIYVQVAGNIDGIFQASSPKGKDYIWTMKCENAPQEYKTGCYRNLYANYPKSIYGANALANIFFDRIKAKDYKEADRLGKIYINNFSDAPSAPFVMFWMGKISQKSFDNVNSESYFKGVISRYPDSYYAYRSYLALKKSNAALLNAKISIKPVEYPYEFKSNKDVLAKLVKLKDYDIIELITEDDFVKSWIYYQKGDLSHSMLLARDAMEKINPRPNREDLRWRLVYPINYFDLIKQYSLNNNAVLMLALVREESYFNPNATSFAGAKGLMQLMPATANEVSSGLDVDLYNPEMNIKLGNMYYSQIRSALNDLDVSAVAAYNGGIGSIARWKTNIIYNDTDEFVEQIPYYETKNYVKKVFRTYWNYLRIYSVED